MDNTIEQLKAYLFPTVISIMSIMIWHDVSEMKADIKQLIVQSNVDKTRIDNLERQFYKTGLKVPTPPSKLPLQVDMRQVVAIKPDEDDEKYHLHHL
jgi:hypothetical protein